jgi:hypothetical protein
MWPVKKRDFQIIVNLLVSNVLSFNGSNAKTLGLKRPQFPDKGASDGSPDGARVVHHGTNEPPVQQNSIPEGETTSV